MAASDHTIREKRYRLTWLAFAGAVAAPALILIACLALRVGVIPLATALDLVTLKIAWPLSWLGGICGLLALFLSRGTGRGGWIPAVLAMVMALSTLSGFVWHFQKASGATSRPDVVTNTEDPPGFSPAIQAAREASAAVPTNHWATDRGTCATVAAVMEQVAPGVAGYGLQQAGFDINSLGVGRADGTRTGFWFGRQWDAVIRIRPGRTDIRVTARDTRPGDEGEACRLASKIASNLQVRE